MTLSIISGIEGQDASFLAELLLEKGHNVVGITRRKSTSDGLSSNLDLASRHSKFEVVFGDIADPTFIAQLVREKQPDNYFNLAAMSHVGQSFKEPVKTFEVNATAVLYALEAIRQHSDKTKFYQASTSELFGTTKCPDTGFVEEDAFHPRSPYGIAKSAAYHLVVNYREAYGLFATNGILHNHSSTRRGHDFATRKITSGVANIVKGKAKHVFMGNLEAYRDEGHAKDYVKAMHLILEQDMPEDFIVATGNGATIKEMLEYVCELAGLKFEDVYRLNEKYMRPSDVPFLKGNPAKIKALGWEPEYDWKALLKEMYEHDLGGER